MDAQPTCGRGLAEHSTLPAKMGEVMALVAEILEVHMTALDLADERSRMEHAAYAELVKEHREIAGQLTTTASRMASYRDLPMGRHDEKVMAGVRAIEAFENFVQLECELVILLQGRLERDRKMLLEMDAGRR